VQGVYRVRKRLVEMLPFHGERVTVQPEDVVRVNFSDSRLEAVVERRKTVMERVTWFVDWVVASYPCVVLVAFGNLSPQPDDSVLVVLVIPEAGIVGDIVRMPIRILSSGGGMQVENGVDLVLGALTSWLADTSTALQGSLTMSTTLSRCLKPSVFNTLGFMSSSKWR